MSSLHELIYRRQTGKHVPPIYDVVSTSLYRGSWESSSCPHAHYLYAPVCGSVFNIEFSPTDNVAVAVCANGSFATHDPRHNSRVRTVQRAHDEGANCVTFLSDLTFATCSDDTTIKLWDLRNLQSSVAVLRGHRGWVKNIEYDARSDLLFSIAFDDGVRVWNVRKPELYSRATSNLVLQLKDSVRLRIAPDSSKMFVSLRQSGCLIVNNFDGLTLHDLGDQVSALFEQRTFRGQERRKVNNPSLHTLSVERNGFRSVMSACFHPGGNFIAMRHLDIKNHAIQQELLSLYDLRAPAYNPPDPIVRNEKNYLKNTEEMIIEDSLDIIKEIHFSSDGKVLASPHNNGARLLSLDLHCTSADTFFDDRFHCPAHTPHMDVVQTLSGHSASVLTCRFAHHDMLLATGCLEGVVCFHHPQL